MTDKSVGDFLLTGNIVLVTGGGSGIGLAFVHLAVAAGAKVLIADLRLIDEADKLAAEFVDQILYVPTDVANWKALENLFQESLRAFGDVPDVYIAGAGLYEPPGRNFWDDVEEESYLELQINVSHPIKLTRMAMRALTSRGKKGVVLSIGSGLGLAGFIVTPLYCATKHALVGFTKSMKAVDAMAGVKIVTVCSGIVDTPLWTAATRAQYSVENRTSDFMTPNEVAQVMKDLVEDGKYGGGTVLEVLAADGKVHTRVVPEWNIDPPRPSGLVRMMTSDPEAIKTLMQPIRERLDEEAQAPWPTKHD